MENEELLKRIELLEQKIASLEFSKENMFGRSYNQIGDTQNDFIIKTSGQVKIQWRNKFIDLIKDGKINTESKFIYQVSSKEDITSAEGIYITENEEIYFKPKNSEPVSLSNSEGNVYVSFLENQETNSENKYQALKNIGFIYKDISEINETSLQNGIIYIESEQKLYIISNGKLIPYENTSIPKQQFVITKNDDSIGALIIKGKNIENSLVFDNMYIYSTDQGNVIDISKLLSILVNKNEILNIDQNTISSKIPIISNKITSVGGSENVGFVLEIVNGKSVLTVDELVERNLETQSEYYLAKEYILSNIEDLEENIYQIQLEGNWELSVGNIIKIDDALFSITSINDNNIIATCLTEFASLKSKKVQLVSPDNPIRIKENSIEIINLQEEKSELKIGKLENDTYGIQSENALFNNAQSLEDIPQDDNSNKFATTKWVNNKSLPSGIIVLSKEVPEGWQLCNIPSITVDGEQINYITKL